MLAQKIQDVTDKILIGVASVVFVSSPFFAGVGHEPVDQEKLLTEAFELASLKKAQENIIKHIIKTEKGNCTILNSDLLEPCEAVKKTVVKLGFNSSNLH